MKEIITQERLAEVVSQGIITDRSSDYPDEWRKSYISIPSMTY